MKNKCLLVYKYPIVLLLATLMIGCHQKLVPRLASTESSQKVLLPDTIKELKVVVARKPLYIDPSYSIDAGIAAMYMRDKLNYLSVCAKVKAFYIQNKFETKWLDQQGPTELYETFGELLVNSFQYGLRPNDYPIDEISRRLNLAYHNPQVSEQELYDLDIQITGAFFLFTTHLMEGRIKKLSYDNKIWINQRREVDDDVALLVQITEPTQLQFEVNKLHPSHDQYLKLKAALDHYRTLESKAAEEDLPVIFVSEEIKPNDVNRSIPLIRKKLAITDMKPDSTMVDSLRYDEKLVSAIKWFQLRHGLEPDGIIGSGTLKFLNQSLMQKIQVIELNMERMRWLPKSYGDNYIAVNIPDFTLRVFENQKMELEMKVIVGAESTPTPVFVDTLWYAVFSPAWGVPNSIIRDEIIPRLQKDSTYYSGRDYTFYKNGVPFDPASETWSSKSINSYSYNVVQQPGPDNALGLVKFIMPNSMNIYLHDTPNHRLFNKSYRALSHGCVRLDDPEKLAAFLLKNNAGWNFEAIDKAMHSNKTQMVYLKKPYRVQIEYRTAWVDDNGLVNFREDIYGHDKRQLSLLNPPVAAIASN